MLNKLLDLKEAAEILGVHKRTLTLMIREDTGPNKIIVGKKIRFTEDAIQDFIDKGGNT